MPCIIKGIPDCIGNELAPARVQCTESMQSSSILVAIKGLDINKGVARDGIRV